jgi:hypothetical protein
MLRAVKGALKALFISGDRYGFSPIRNAPTLKLNNKDSIVILEPVILEEIDPSYDEPIILYRRKEVTDLFNFLRRNVLDQGFFGWICGPPGSGKSVASLAFACSMDRDEWTITWISLNRSRINRITHLDKEGIRSFSFIDSDLDILDSYLKEKCYSEKHIVFLDGYVQNFGRNDDIKLRCQAWLKKNLKDRRMVTVCSMSSRDDRIEENKKERYKDFFMYSWTIKDYENAIAHDIFYAYVKKFLDAIISTDRYEALIAKHFFAGGSARHMFTVFTEDLIDAVKVTAAAAKSFKSVADGDLGERSQGVKNRIFAKYEGNSKMCIVSKFMAEEIGKQIGPDQVANFARTIDAHINPAMNGWFFEILFFCRLRDGSLVLTDLGSIEQSFEIDFHSHSFPRMRKGEKAWFKPIRFNQGGYDAVFVDVSAKLVQVFQITTAKSHTFKIEFFANLMNNIIKSNSDLINCKLEIYYVVESHKIASFKVGAVSGIGSLVKFGWKSGKEFAKIKKVGMEGIKGLSQVQKPQGLPKKKRRTSL